MKKIKWLAARSRETSTWLGISVLLGFLGLPAPVVMAIGGLLDLAPSIIDHAAVLVAGSVAIALPEAGSDA